MNSSYTKNKYLGTIEVVTPIADDLIGNASSDEIKQIALGDLLPLSEQKIMGVYGWDAIEGRMSIRLMEGPVEVGGIVQGEKGKHFAIMTSDVYENKPFEGW